MKKVVRMELWLDESGSFEDKCNHNTPSLVGGILVEEDSIPLDELHNILDENFTHCSGLDPSISLEKTLRLLPYIRKYGGYLVIFENDLRIKVVNSTITYLNIISEGIIQLLQQLAAEHPRGHLQIFIAVRSDMAAQYTSSSKQIIPYEEYRIRLEEKLILGMAKKTIAINDKWTWDIKFGLGQKEIRLKAADPVCNFWLTRTSNKYSSQDKYSLESLYEERYTFYIFSRSTEGYLNRLMAQGDLAEAIYEISTIDGLVNKKDINQVIIERISRLDYESLRIQLIYLRTQIEVLLKIEKNISKSIPVLSYIQKEFIIPLRKYRNDIGTFELDIYLYLLTAYTHTGNIIKAEEEILLFEEALQGLTNRWESIEYYFIFKLRKAVHLINCFNHNGAINELNNLIETLKGVSDAFSIVEGLDKLYSNIKSDFLGKALGTRIQALCLDVKNDERAYSSAISDYEAAIKEFNRESDIIRQFQYRAQIECESGHYTKALEYIFKVVNVSFQNNVESINEFLCLLKEQNKSTKIHCVKLYVKAMSIALRKGDCYIGDLLYDCILRDNTILQESDKSDCKEHPYEIINWKLATYCSIKGKRKEALRYYNKAIEICFSDFDRLTMRAIGLAILAEKTAFLYGSSHKDQRLAKEALRVLQKKYNSFMEENLPQSMKEYFCKWKSILKLVKEKSDVNYKIKLLWGVSDDISY